VLKSDVDLGGTNPLTNSGIVIYDQDSLFADSHEGMQPSVRPVKI